MPASWVFPWCQLNTHHYYTFSSFLAQESELERLTRAREAELKYIREQNELEISKSRDLSSIETDKFKNMVDSIGSDTLASIATAGPEMQVGKEKNKQLTRNP